MSLKIKPIFFVITFLFCSLTTISASHTELSESLDPETPEVIISLVSRIFKDVDITNNPTESALNCLSKLNQELVPEFMQTCSLLAEFQASDISPVITALTRKTLEQVCTFGKQLNNYAGEFSLAYLHPDLRGPVIAKLAALSSRDLMNFGVCISPYAQVTSERFSDDVKDTLTANEELKAYIIASCIGLKLTEIDGHVQGMIVRIDPYDFTAIGDLIDDLREKLRTKLFEQPMDTGEGIAGPSGN